MIDIVYCKDCVNYLKYFGKCKLLDEKRYTYDFCSRAEKKEELIRCKDCKFYNPDANVGYLAYCDLAENYEHLDPEWFCCHAERRETDEKR